MRQDGTIVRTRAFRPRTFPTQYGHAALRRAIGVTCVYQSDSSSKRPVAFVAFRTLLPTPGDKPTTVRKSVGGITTHTNVPGSTIGRTDKPKVVPNNDPGGLT